MIGVYHLPFLLSMTTFSKEDAANLSYNFIALQFVIELLWLFLDKVTKFT